MIGIYFSWNHIPKGCQSFFSTLSHVDPRSYMGKEKTIIHLVVPETKELAAFS